MKPVADILSKYLRDATSSPANAVLDIEKLPEEFHDFGSELQYFVECVMDARKLALAMSRGDLNSKTPPPSNEIAAPLKSLHASLRHLTWQTRQIAQGDYRQRVDFMGDFATAFNTMTQQLEERRKYDIHEKSRLQQYINMILLNTPDILLVFDEEDKAVLASESCRRLSKIFSTDEIQGKSFTELFLSLLTEEFLHNMNNLLHDVRVSQDTVKIEQDLDFGLDGNSKTYLISVAPMLYENEKIMGTVVIFHDITDMRQVQRETERAFELAEQFSKAKSDFLARMSHEIRSPMNSVLGVTELQLQNENLPKETEEAFLHIYHSSTLLLSIINNILDLSKIEAGKMTTLSVPYGLSSVIANSVQMCLRHRGDKDIVFELNVDEHLPASLIGDEFHIEQIIVNLLTNAFKYTQEGAVTVNIGQERTPDGGFTLVIEVLDTGQGMTEEQVNLADKEFARFNEQINRSIEGSGLGLSIVYQLVKLMDGKLAVDSTFGKGSAFVVRIPQGIDGSRVIGRKTAENFKNFIFDLQPPDKVKKIARHPMPYGRALIVDDLESNLYVAKQILKLYKINIQTEKRGEKAVSRIENGEVYDIIFMDHMMPGMDGVEAVKRIRSLGYSLPIVALTANAIKGMEEIFLSNGFSDFISKPIDLKRMDEILMRYIHDKQSPEVIEEAKAAQDAAVDDSMDHNGNSLIESFVRDAQRTVRNIESLLEKQEWDEEYLKTYTLHVHNIRSALLNIGRMSFSEEAQVLEKAGRSGDVDTIRTHTADFLSDLKRLTATLLLAKPELVASELISEEARRKFQELLSVFAEACDIYDIDGANNAINTLNALPCPKEIKVFMDEITTYLLHGAFEEAGKLALQAAQKMQISTSKN